MAAAAEPGRRRAAQALGGFAATLRGGPGTGGALGLAVASVLDSLLALAFTVAFARVLGAEGYGSLAALVSLFLIGSIAGAALQVTIARRAGAEGAARRWPIGPSAEGWTRRLGLAAALGLGAGALAREPLAAALGVDERWAAALILPAVILDLALAAQRGALLGLGDYRSVALSLVATPAGWLLFGGALAAAGLGVGGVVGGIALAELLNVLALRAVVRRRAGARDEPPGRPLGLRELVGGAWVPILALGLFAALQNLDVIVVRRVADDTTASSYAAAAVAAKAILWVAIGIGLYLVPEAARRHAEGRSSRALLGGGLALVAAAGLPMVVIYLAAGRPLLRAVFGAELAAGADALPTLAVATTLLAWAYLAVQLLLAHGRRAFLGGLAAAAVAEIVLVALAAPGLGDVARVLVALQLIVAGAAIAAAVRSAGRPLALGAETS